MLNLSLKGSFSSVQFQFQAVLAVGAGRSLRHSLETLVVHPAPEQTAAPGQPPLPHPRVGTLPPTYTGGGAAIMNYTATLALTFLYCALGVRQFVRFVGGFALFCCFVLGFFFAFLFKIQAGSDQKQLKERWEDVLSDCYCSFQRLENTFSVLLSEGWTH